MPTIALSAQFVRQAGCAPGRKKTDYFDVGQRGFLLEVRCSGGKTFYQRYTDERGRERQYKIGPAEVLSLEQARRKARQVVAEALLGVDPQQKRREMRAVPQLKNFVAERYLPYVRTYKTSWQTDETVLRIHILPKLGALALDEIKTDAISALINGMREDGYAAGTMNRVIVILRYIYNLARKWKMAGRPRQPGGRADGRPGRAAQPLPHRAGGGGPGAFAPCRRKPDRRPRHPVAAADRRARVTRSPMRSGITSTGRTRRCWCRSRNRAAPASSR